MLVHHLLAAILTMQQAVVWHKWRTATSLLRTQLCML